MSKEGTIYTIVFVFIVSFAFVFLLSLTNQATIERVELNQEITRQTAILLAMGIEAGTSQDVQTNYQSVAADSDAGLYVATVNGQLVYGKQFAGPGLWGTIEGVLAVNADLSEIVGIEILSDNETPGLGGRINEPWFKDQFRGELLTAAGIDVTQTAGEGDRDPANGLIDGVTGATRTSDSMEAIVNRELQALRSNEIQDILRSLESEGDRS
jgi:Na+-transporting NADH:ubiquinone oxidoreductase subunit C